MDGQRSAERPVAGLSEPGAASPAAVALGCELGLSLSVADVLVRRGFGADERTARYLEPKLAHLTPPGSLRGWDAAVGRLGRAVRERQRVTVFGDYDCDGITATAIVTELLRSLGAEARPLLAQRFAGGYGLSEPALGRVVASPPNLLVVCDCGSSDHERIAAAQAAGIDVVVLDHHLPPAEPLPTAAFINPRQPGCAFPYKGLSSCGLALLLATGLRRTLGVSLDVRRWLDLVAIGTIADVAPLDGDNRILVRAGLTALGAAERAGLRALAELGRRGRARTVTAEEVAFQLAPRLNAPGRLGDAQVALDLLLATDGARATELGAEVERLGQERKRVQQQMLAEAIADVASGGHAELPVLVLGRAGWHPGVVGVVAGRLAALYGKPTAVLAFDGELGRGSVRAPAGFPVHDSLGACRQHLTSFGGHQAAAGLEVRTSELDAFRRAWASECAARGARVEGLVAARPAADARLDERDDPEHVVADLDRLEPFGESNPVVRLRIDGLRVRTARDVQGHLKLGLERGRWKLGGFGPGRGAEAGGVVGRTVDVVGQLRRDAWRGGSALELLVEDWQEHDADARADVVA